VGYTLLRAAGELVLSLGFVGRAVSYEADAVPRLPNRGMTTVEGTIMRFKYTGVLLLAFAALVVGCSTGVTADEVRELVRAELASLPVPEPGPAGLPGAQGERGEPGEPGPIGLTAQPETEGPQGERGEPGVTGPSGDVGPQGERGEAGVTGPSGDAGPQGESGLIGLTGPPGAVGLSGAQGERGEPGPIGLTGLQGPQGTQSDEILCHTHIISEREFSHAHDWLWDSWTGESYLGGWSPRFDVETISTFLSSC